MFYSSIGYRDQGSDGKIQRKIIMTRKLWEK